MRYFKALFFAVFLTIATLPQLLAYGETAQCADSVIVIGPVLDEGTGGKGPRSPAVIPIFASYESLLSSVLLTFTSNLGEIEVEVMNTTTGDYISEMIDTQFLSATVPITMGPGHYLILFTLPSGRQYKGEFDL